MLYNNKKIWFDSKGYAVIWRAGQQKKVHILEWEKYNGKKPKGYEVHHKDENKANWNIDNLQLETPSSHQRIHAGWIRKNGIWILKPCNNCNQILPLDKFYPRKGLTPSALCKECSKSTRLKKIKKFSKYKIICKFCKKKAIYRKKELCPYHYQKDYRQKN